LRCRANQERRKEEKMMIEQKKLSRRTLLKGLLATPVMIPFQTDAQTIYRAITSEWEENSEIRELVIISKSFSFSQPSHLIEAFGELYPQFITVDTVLKELKHNNQLWQVGNQKVQFKNVKAYRGQKVRTYYQDITTTSPTLRQKEVLSMVRQSGLRSLVREANYPPLALEHELDGCVFGYLPSNRHGMDDVNSKFVKVNNDNYRTVGWGSVAFLVTQAVFHLGSYWLERWRDQRKRRIEPEWKDTGVVWKEEPGWYRHFNPPIFRDMALERENVSPSSKNLLRYSFPGGQNHIDTREEKITHNITIKIYWYPSYKQYSWMGESPSKWYYDQRGRPKILTENLYYVENPFNVLVYKDSSGKTYARFFKRLV